MCSLAIYKLCASSGKSVIPDRPPRHRLLCWQPLSLRPHRRWTQALPMRKCFPLPRSCFSSMWRLPHCQTSFPIIKGIIRVRVPACNNRRPRAFIQLAGRNASHPSFFSQRRFSLCDPQTEITSSINISPSSQSIEPQRRFFFPSRPLSRNASFQ